MKANFKKPNFSFAEIHAQGYEQTYY